MGDCTVGLVWYGMVWRVLISRVCEREMYTPLYQRSLQYIFVVLITSVVGKVQEHGTIEEESRVIGSSRL